MDYRVESSTIVSLIAECRQTFMDIPFTDLKASLKGNDQGRKFDSHKLERLFNRLHSNIHHLCFYTKFHVGFTSLTFCLLTEVCNTEVQCTFQVFRHLAELHVRWMEWNSF